MSDFGIGIGQVVTKIQPSLEQPLLLPNQLNAATGHFTYRQKGTHAIARALIEDHIFNHFMKDVQSFTRSIMVAGNRDIVEDPVFRLQRWVSYHRGATTGLNIDKELFNDWKTQCLGDRIADL